VQLAAKSIPNVSVFLDYLDFSASFFVSFLKIGSVELEQLIEALKACRNRKPGLTAIEKKLGMPENALSGMLSGKRKLPKKWVHPLTEYVEILKKNEVKNEPENKERTTKEREEIADPIQESIRANYPPLSDADIYQIAETAKKSPPPGLTKTQQIRWHRENTQTLQ
jgi:hypothetical protein